MGISQFTAGQEITALELNQLPVVVSYLTTGSVANSAAETSIGTFTIPAGDPTSPGGYWFYVHGVCTTVSNPTLAIRARLTSTGGTQLAFASGTVTTPGGFDVLLWMGMEAIGSSGSFGNFAQTSVPSVSTLGTWGTDATAINTTIANTLVITAQFGTASASNTATTKFGSLYRL